MKVSLATSLHLDHAAMTLDRTPGDPIPLQSFVPVGLLCLKAYVESLAVPAQVRVTEVNGLINSGQVPNDGFFFERLADALLVADDHLVGLMTDADSLHHTLVLARELKRCDPEVLICLGGPASSPISAEVLAAFPWVDYVIRGEGEVSFAALLEHLEAGRQPADVRGLTWRDRAGQIHRNPDCPIIEDLDSLPIPSSSATGVGSDAAMYLDVGRGCPFKCHFCATAPFWNRRYRMKSIHRILAEMKQQSEVYNRRHVSFSHDIFTCNQRWTMEFCERLADEQIGMTWSCSTRTDTINTQLIEWMARAGCVEIYYGIESGSAEMQRHIHKNLDLENSRRIVAATAAAGIRPVTGFILGYPAETRQTFKETLGRFFDFLEVGGHRAHLFTLCPFHGAPMHREEHPISRRAAYFEPPFIPSQLTKSETLCEANGEIFTSLMRFATPQVDEALVDASEEISSRIVSLKSVWPHLLPHYQDALDWFERWVRWISARNASKRPATRMPFHGEIYDLLDFLDAEVVRLELKATGISDLVRYERQKLNALESLPMSPRNASPLDVSQPHRVNSGSVVKRSRECVIVPFDRDLGGLLHGDKSLCNTNGRPGSAVVFIRRNGYDLDTLQIGPLHASVLSRLSDRRRVQDLLDHQPLDADKVFDVVQDLIAFDLIVEVDDASSTTVECNPLPRSERIDTCSHP